ncbi:MAG: bifunctional phosphopantothenoylcysteine decarboxylase/phosphopantothenate--cysteine ligase CoaBC [Bacteroidales bacterium]|nr:bifunctional phosphopantothenoylcysteine decarboxylase/phosphopantothenate--cysteine ligase CoaBC [Bacteroidales bacterium]
MHVVVGITGGIAAYKAPEVVRQLVKMGHEVRCAATEHALRFVARCSLETVSAAPLYCDLFEGNRHSTEHISIKDWADLVVVAPATANCLGKLASGIADDALSTLLLAVDPRRVLLAPAMNSQMWAHPAVQRNVAMLRGWGVGMVGPDEGQLACGTEGRGRMAEPSAIVAEADRMLSALRDGDGLPRLDGQRWLVTAGPTYERIDSVRFIGNYSSGKMGFALAEALANAGAAVELVCGPTSLAMNRHGVTRTDVESAVQMYDAATSLFPRCDGAILSAAVADYRPEHVADHKLKKQGGEGLELKLVQNPDILAELGRMKQGSQRLVGFALETDNEVANAEEKLRRKHLDYIVLNSLRDAGAGFGVDTNKVTILAADGAREESGLMSKHDVARLIVKTVAS